MNNYNTVSRYDYIIILSRFSEKCKTIQSRLSTPPFNFIAGETLCRNTGTQIIFIDNKSIQTRIKNSGITHVPSLIQVDEGKNMQIFGADQAFEYVNSIQQMYNQNLQEQEMKRRSEEQLRLAQNESNLIPEPDTDYEHELRQKLKKKRKSKRKKYKNIEVLSDDTEDELDNQNDILEDIDGGENVLIEKRKTVRLNNNNQFEVTDDFVGEDISSIRPENHSDNTTEVESVGDKAAAMQAERDAMIPKDNRR